MLLNDTFLLKSLMTVSPILINWWIHIPKAFIIIDYDDIHLYEAQKQKYNTIA